MFCLTKYCTSALTRINIPRLLPVRNNFYTCTRKPTISNTVLTFVKRNSINLHKDLIKKRGTIGVGFASKPCTKSDKIVGNWLLICSHMVVVAVFLGIVIYFFFYYCACIIIKAVVDETYGGFTRLSESGLSMVTWNLLGEKMPVTESEWDTEFLRYKEYPEYKISKHDMTLDEFKKIWWTEYFHRMWGRFIGAVFFIPATIFWAKGMLSPKMKIRVVGMGSLIGLQGLMGWYMVQSGLEDRFKEPSDVPRVSQYRLAAHLGMALVLYTALWSNILDLLAPAKILQLSEVELKNTNLISQLKRFRILAHSTKAVVFLTALSGAIVAGLDAGLIYNTFPKMANKWIPDDIFTISPVWKNFTENPTTAQFDHRIMGITTLALITSIAIISRKYKLPGYGKTAVLFAVCSVYLQAVMGISTLLQQVTLPSAVSHQFGSIMVLTSMIWLCHELKYVKYLVK